LRFYVTGVVAVIGLVVWEISMRRAPIEVGPSQAQEGGTEAPSAQNARASPRSVSITHFLFEPKEVVVPVGTTVTWVNGDDVAHTVTSTASSPLFDSRTLRAAATFSFEFKVAGTYDYFCKAHPYMTGTIVVK
jgi:plastocyanin